MWLLLAGGAQAQMVSSGSYNGTADAIVPGTSLSTGAVTATGGTVSRSLAGMAADVINIKNYGALGNTYTASDGAITASSTTFTSASASFASPAAGKTNYILIRGAGTGGISFITTVTGYTSRTQVTLAAAPPTTVSGAVYFFGTDDTAAVTAAASAASTGHQCLYFPAGGYWLASQSSTVTLQDTCWEGDATTGVGADYTHNGSTLLVSQSTVSPITLQRGVNWESLAVYYPAQDGSATVPLTYPAFFTSTYAENDNFTNVQFINPYELLEITPNTGILGDVRFVNTRAYCVFSCFYFLGGAPDVLQITNSFFSEGVYEDTALAGNEYLGKWSGANGEFIHIDVNGASHPSIDGLQISNSIIYGFRYGIRVVSGLLNVSMLTGNAFDGVPTVLSIEGANGSALLTWTGGYVASSQLFGSGDTYPVINLPCTGEVTDIVINGVNFTQSNGPGLSETNFCLRSMTFTGNRMNAWGQNLASTLSFGIGNTANYTERDTYVGNYFYCNQTNSNSPIPIATEANWAIISGNHFAGACAYSVEPIGSVGLFIVDGNISDATFGNYSLNDVTTGTAIIYEGLTNVWDKASNVGHPSGQNTLTLHGLVSPTVTAGSTKCGTSPSVASNSADGVGSVTVGSSTNGGACPIVFALPHVNAPDCHGTDQTTTTVSLSSPATKTGVTLKGAFLAGDVLTYSCTFFQ